MTLAGLDSGRIALWRVALTQCWWPQGWRVRLLGWGAGTWQRQTQAKTLAQCQGVIFTTAHNEYVQTLCEYGVIGLGLLLWVVADALWTCVTGDATQQAIGLVWGTLCLLAATTFPWSWFHAVADRRPFAVTLLAVHPEHGLGLQTYPGYAMAQRAGRTWTASGMPAPTVTLWYPDHAPITASLEEPVEQVDRTPKHVGSPALNWLSFLLLCLAGGGG